MQGSSTLNGGITFHWVGEFGAVCRIGTGLRRSYNYIVDGPSDEKLLRDYLNGDEAAFELLVRRHSPELHQFVLRFTGDSAVAEDVVQEAFLQVHTSGDRFDPDRRFKPWLFTIAANKARDYLRKRTRRHEVTFDAQINEEDGGGQRFIQLLSGEAPPPDDILQTDEKRRLVKKIVDEMPGNLREVLTLAYFHRFPYKDIGDILGVPLGTVKSRLHAAVAYFGDRYRMEVTERAEHGATG